MPAAVYPGLQSAVLLCIDDNEDMLECEESFLESFIATDCLASQLLPTIAQLCGYASSSQPSCDG
jgi:hypothetical protein